MAASLVMIVIAMAIVCIGHEYITVEGFRPWPPSNASLLNPDLYKASLANEGSSSYINMQYHMGPVLTGGTKAYIIWYGKWKASQKSIIKDFLYSISTNGVKGPSVKKWWSTAQFYTDQTGSNVSSTISLAAECDDDYSQGKSLTRMTVQQVIKNALVEHKGTLPVAPKGGLYLVLTADDVVMQDYCRAVCGFHYFTYPSIAGYALPYAWIGNSGKLCPEVCAYPFAVPAYMGSTKAFKPPNGDIGMDGMVSVIAHELAEMSANPLINAWFAGTDPTAPVEIADLCEGMYGTGAGGSYTGMVLNDKVGASYNLVGIRGRRFLVQWLWSPVLNACTGPNRLD
eukprot:Gb_04585 [translate_table: standard]